MFLRQRAGRNDAGPGTISAPHGHAARLGDGAGSALDRGYGGEPVYRVDLRFFWRRGTGVERSAPGDAEGHHRFSKKKNNKVDACTIAALLRCNLLPECHMALCAIRDLRRAPRYAVSW